NIQQATARQDYFTPSDAWCETLAWVKDNTPEDSFILSWWDYGYWILRMADREVYVDPCQSKGPVTKVAKMFTSPYQGEREIEADYLILDHSTVTSKFWAIVTWAGEEPSEFYAPAGFDRKLIYHPEYYQCLAVHLYNFDGKAVSPGNDILIGTNPFISPVPLEAVEGYTLVYESRQKIKGLVAARRRTLVSPIKSGCSFL
ncbi:unnamed protein product, partial [marine sediment metagenome]